MTITKEAVAAAVDKINKGAGGLQELIIVLVAGGVNAQAAGVLIASICDDLTIDVAEVLEAGEI